MTLVKANNLPPHDYHDDHRLADSFENVFNGPLGPYVTLYSVMRDVTDQ